MEFQSVKGLSRASALILALALLPLTSSAMVVLSNVTDSNGSSSLFDTSTITQSGANGEIIDLGLTDFFVDETSLSPNATDTLSMTITAPDGYLITSITYTEEGNGKATNGGMGVGGFGVALATGSVVADGIPTGLGTHMLRDR